MPGQNTLNRTMPKRPKVPLYQTFDPSWLREQYVTLQRTKDSIAAELHVAPATVTHSLEWHGIERPPDLRPELTEAMLRELYEVQGLYMREISEQTGYCETKIGEWLEKFGIRSRGRGASRPPKDKPWHDEGWLIHNHYHLGLTYAEMAAIAGCHPQTIVKAMARCCLTQQQDPQEAERDLLPEPVRELLPEPPKMNPVDFTAIAERARIKVEEKQTRQVAAWLADIVYG